MDHDIHIHAILSFDKFVNIEADNEQELRVELEKLLKDNDLSFLFEGEPAVRLMAYGVESEIGLCFQSDNYDKVCVSLKEKENDNA